MRGNLRKIDTLGRIGGDEFAVVAEDINAADHTALVAQKLLEAVTQPFFLEGVEVTATASVGAALFPYDGTKAEKLWARANEALAAAKAAGGNAARVAQA
ncbi:MAG: diguanylate cyclase domain-containing protein [Actinomycetota bacterium]